MKNRYLFLLAAILISSAVTHAGEQEGHGGDVVVCGQTYTLYDYYIKEKLTGIRLEMGPPTSNYLKVVDYVMNRLAKFDPVAALRLTKRAHEFEQNMYLASDAEMKTLPDYHEPINVDQGCQQVQFAVQTYPAIEFQKIYTVRKSAWNAADSFTKAGLVLHEVIFTDALNMGETDSDHTRLYNFIISSEKMNSFKPVDYVSFLQGVDFPDIECLFSVKNFGAPGVVSCAFFDYTTPPTNDGSIGIDDRALKKVGISTAFLQGGYHLSVKADYCMENQQSSGCAVMPQMDQDFQFSVSGIPVFLPTNIGKVFNILADNSPGAVLDQTFNDDYYSLWIRKTGIPGAAFLKQDTQIVVNGTLQQVKARSALYFDKDGKVTGVLATVPTTSLHIGNRVLSVAQSTASNPESPTLDFQPVQIQGRMVYVWGVAVFYDNGSFGTANLTGPISLKMNDGTTVNLPVGDYTVQFNQNEEMTSYQKL